MLKTEVARATLRSHFQRNTVADLGTLFRILDTQSRMSVFRRLRDVGSRTSFTHGGRYYTLDDAPQFDDNGLWFFRSIGFSIAGTLIDTVVQLVERSPAGLSYGQLRKITTVRVENVLVSLVREERLERRRIGRRSLYVACDQKLASRQVMERTAQAQPDVPLPLVVEILLEVIRAGAAYVPPDTVVARLVSHGIIVNAHQVVMVYATYGLTPEKKTTMVPPSSSSDS